MRCFILSAAVCLCAAATPAGAIPLAAGKAAPAAPMLLEDAQSSGSRNVRRCMRAKYGPRYFSRVPRAVRWHMAQACMA